jgi:hypothetical protein
MNGKTDVSNTKITANTMNDSILFYSLITE